MTGYSYGRDNVGDVTINMYYGIEDRTRSFSQSQTSSFANNYNRAAHDIFSGETSNGKKLTYNAFYVENGNTDKDLRFVILEYDNPNKHGHSEPGALTMEISKHAFEIAWQSEYIDDLNGYNWGLKVALHENGHNLGLRHPDRYSSIDQGYELNPSKSRLMYQLRENPDNYVKMNFRYYVSPIERYIMANFLFSGSHKKPLIKNEN